MARADVVAAALTYKERGWEPVPVHARQKRPVGHAWQKSRRSEDEIRTDFRGDVNVGVLLGEPSGGLVDVDLDAPQTLRVADELLRETSSVFGRPGKPRSHRLFRVGSPPRTERFTDTDGAVLVEIRGTGGQTLFPPSIHPSGEPIGWVQDGEPLCLEAETLHRDVARVAAAALLSRHWPAAGARHEAAKAVAGALVRADWPEDEAGVFILEVARAAGDDEFRGRPDNVRTTIRRLSHGGAATGLPTLERLIGKEAAEKFADWLGLRGGGDDAEKDEGPGLTWELASAITADVRFAQDSGLRLYVFNGGVYRTRGEEFVRRAVKTLLGEWNRSDEWSRHATEEVVEYVRVDSPQLWERPPLDVINVRNGLLNVVIRELSPHSPEFLSAIQLPVTYDPGAGCPAWEQQVRETFPPDACEAGVPWEIPARLMTPDTSDQRAELLQGIGGSGKSTYLAGLVAFLGKENVSSLSLHRLENDRFSTSRLIGKLANVCPDLPSAHLESSAMFKAITGGDRIPAEYKFKDSFDFEPFVRLIFSANDLPRSADASDAFFQRWRVVPFERVFRGTDDEIPRPELDARLSDPKELSGLLNRALNALPRIRRGGLTETETMRRAHEEFRRITDPVSVWLDRNAVEDPRAVVAKGELLAAYNEACQREGRPPATSKGFSMTVKRLRPHLGEAQRTVGGKTREVWLSLGLKEADAAADAGTPVGSCDSGDSPPHTRRRAPASRGNGESRTGKVKSREPHEPPRLRPCGVCGGKEFWESTHGTIVCVRCHPPAAPSLVVRLLQADGADQSNGRPPQTNDGAGEEGV